MPMQRYKLTIAYRGTRYHGWQYQTANQFFKGPKPAEGADPEFALVAYRGEVKEPLDHFGFQCETRDQVTSIAELARERGNLVEGPIDHGGSVGYYAVLREPSGHLVEFTHGQPMRGLRTNGA